LTEAFKFGDEVMVEKFVGGTEITVGVLGRKALPVVEIVPKGAFYDFKSKYTPGQSDHIIPARIGAKTTALVKRLAIDVFNVLGCRAVGRVDMIIDKNKKPWVLEMNTLPGMTNTSLLPDEARADGMSFGGLLLKIIECSF
jgi:D-alanine-D-alanine ligase